MLIVPPKNIAKIYKIFIDSTGFFIKSLCYCSIILFEEKKE
ncbi:MAG: hypothetical protein ABRQ37_26600 [Candidatus Eremiobacterota bacterium]